MYDKGTYICDKCEQEIDDVSMETEIGEDFDYYSQTVTKRELHYHAYGCPENKSENKD